MASSSTVYSDLTGYVPKMRVYSVQPSGMFENGTEINTTEVEYDFSSRNWQWEIPLSEAMLTLERTMYPFKKVDPFPVLEIMM